MAIAGATTAVVNPWLVPVAILGSTAPDWFETIANKLFGARWGHRQQTHYLTHWIGALLFFIFVADWHGILAAFAWGGLTHIITDSLTVSGVPFSPWSPRRFHLFGGRLTTGSSGEYLVSVSVVAACFFVVSMTGGFNTGFSPFFTDWYAMYEAGIIDASELRANRFHFF